MTDFISRKAKSSNCISILTKLLLIKTARPANQIILSYVYCHGSPFQFEVNSQAPDTRSKRKRNSGREKRVWNKGPGEIGRIHPIYCLLMIKILEFQITLIILSINKPEGRKKFLIKLDSTVSSSMEEFRLLSWKIGVIKFPQVFCLDGFSSLMTLPLGHVR